MTGVASVLASVAALIVFAATAYRMSVVRKTDSHQQFRRTFAWSASIVAGAVFGLWSAIMDAPALSYEHAPAPVVLAIAFDLSPSMLAVPDPDFAPGEAPRFERGKQALLAVMRALEEREQPVLVSLIGFTREANMLMGWNQNVAQSGEAIRYALVPGLFGGSGTSLEAAVESVEDAFAMLPAAYADARQFAIIISDGEDTMREASFGYALDRLENSSFGIVALQAGTLDSNEGIPLYNRLGQFTGFRRMGGKLHTRPDVAAMNAVALPHTGRGIYLRAESPTAVPRIMEFVLGGRGRSAGFDVAVLPGLGMFGAVFLLCLWMFR
jgi:hypothetical protein